MKALLLVGGKGTRLRPLTNRIPKPMVPIMGRPLLERTLEMLKQHNTGEIVLSTCYKPEYISGYFGNGSKLGLNIHYVRENTPLGTGGAIKNSEQYFDDPFLVLNADILSDIDYSEMMRFHKQKKADVTIAVTWVKNPSAYGVIEYDGGGYATSFREKPKTVSSHFINAGVYVFEPQVLKEIPAERPVSVEREVFPKLLEKGMKIAVYQGCNYWMDIGTPAKYVQANLDAFSGKLRLPENRLADHSAQSGPGISRGVTFRGPVYIGKNVRIGNEAVVGPYVILGDNCAVGTGCEIANSLFWNNIRVGSGTTMTDCIVTDGCRINGPSRCRRLICTPDSVEGVESAAV